LLALACFALSPSAQAVVPAPDGGYPGQNTAEGENALFNLTTGSENTAIGFRALFSITDSFSNTPIGASALSVNRSGTNNTATGAQAMASNTIGNCNTATGSSALGSNTRGIYNTANGFAALRSNTTASFNIANGSQALFNNTTGHDNTANGRQALYSNTDGFFNTATASDALFSNTIGSYNTATGVSALTTNTTGSFNTAIGLSAMASNATGQNNTATGANALNHNTTGSNNIALGFSAGGNLSTGNDNIDIGNAGVAGESGTMRLGTVRLTATYILGINGATVPGGVGVIIDSTGHLGTVQSSARFKEAIKPMGRASEALLALEPVTFRYKHDVDPAGIPQFGLVAEQVEKVNPDLVARDDKGKPYTVRYEAVNAMLLNEFLKAHKIQKLEANNAQLQRNFAEQQKQIEMLTAGLQKVSARGEMSKGAPQTALNNQ
jgi:hypothetical protein